MLNWKKIYYLLKKKIITHEWSKKVTQTFLENRKIDDNAESSDSIQNIKNEYVTEALSYFDMKVITKIVGSPRCKENII